MKCATPPLLFEPSGVRTPRETLHSSLRIEKDGIAKNGTVRPPDSLSPENWRKL